METFNRTATTSERLKEALSFRNMRQTDLAKATGIDKGSISCYVSGRYEPKNEAICKMAQALSVSEMWLWGYSVPIERSTAPTLGEIISAYRDECGMSIEDFAKKSGMSTSYISALEKNKYLTTGKPVQVTVENIMQAAKAMDVNFVELMVATCDMNEIKENMNSLQYVAENDRSIVEHALKNNLAPIELPEKIQALNVLLHQYKYDIVAREGGEYSISYDFAEGASGMTLISDEEISEIIDSTSKHLELVTYNVVRRILDRYNNSNIDIHYPEQKDLP